MVAALSMEDVRETIEKLDQPEVFPRADDDAQFQAIMARVRAAPKLADKLSIAGFTLEPVEHGGVEQACETCMYFLGRRKWCDLPGLDVPAEPEWSCRLWRI